MAIWRISAVLLLTSTLAASASAQQWGDPAAAARVKLGPLGLTPTIAATGIGIDPNVFNTATNPSSDWTTTLEGAMNLWLRLGSNWLAGTSRANYVYFRDFASQRTLSTVNTLRLEVPLNRIKVFAGGAIANMHDRPGPDIDLRLQHNEYRVNGGLDLRLGGRTTLAMSTERMTTAFESDLADQLNRSTQVATLSLQQTLTPLTSFVLNGNAQINQFAAGGGRDNVIVQLMPGLMFKPLALLTGQFDVGVMRVYPSGSGSRPFQGMAVDVNLAYTLGSSTRVGTRVDRSVNYSFDPASPYYVLTDQSVSVDHRFSDRWSIGASGVRSNMAYPAGGLLTKSSFTDHVYTFDAGMGYRLGQRVQLGVHVNHIQRVASPDSLAGDFQSTRVVSSVTYGAR